MTRFALLFIFVMYSVLGLCQSTLSRHYSERNFKREGLDLSKIPATTPEFNLHLDQAENNIRTSKGFLAIGITSGVIGTSLLVASASNYKPIRPYRASFIISAISLNIVVLPVSLVMREYYLKRARREITIAKTLTETF